MVFAYFPLLRVFLPGRRLLQHFPDFLHQVFGQAGLGDEGVAAGAPRALGNAGERVAGEGDHRDARRAAVGLEPPGRLPPVHHRQRQIHQDDIGLALDRLLERLDAVAGFDHVEAGILQVFAVHLARVRVIVDEQHTRPFWFGLVHFRPWTGSVRVKVEPFPTWLCTAIRPPSICARRLQIDSPSPVPP